MVGTVKTRRTHYEVLSLEPTATSDEIERAFAGSISIFQPHGFSGVAEAAVAFRTLRDPARRRAYDASLGLGPKPEKRPAPMSWRVGAQFLTASGTRVMAQAISRPAIEGVALAEPQAAPQPPSEPPPEPSAEPEAPPFIAAALRELARPEPLVESAPAIKQGAVEVRKVASNPSVHLALGDAADETEGGAIPWKRAGIAAASVALAVALIGGWAGWDSVGGAEPAENVAKAPLPPPTTFTLGDPATAAPDRVLDDARPLPPKRTARAKTRTKRARPTSRLAELDRQLLAPSEASPPQPGATEQAPAIAPVTAAAADLPLPNPVIARTIERIGYQCGQVASTAQGKAPGVFTVTCTSGHSYQAAPVRGRYHFRRVSSR